MRFLSIKYLIKDIFIDYLGKIMVLAHNILAVNAQRQFNITGISKKKSAEKLSSGYRINRAADDAAGLTISEKMRSQIRGLSQGVNNCQDGVSLCQVADGAMAEVDDMLHRMNELCIQAANGTNTSADREAIDKEVQQLKTEIDRIGNETEFNEIKVLQSNQIIMGYKKEEVISKEFVKEPYTKEITVFRDNTMRDFVSSHDNPYIKQYFGIECNKNYGFDTNVSLNIKDLGNTSCSAYTLDFSKINSEEDWLNLDGAAMYYCCTAGCGQRFIFMFDSSFSGINNLTPDNHDMMTGGAGNWIMFSVGTQGFTKGSEFVTAMLDFAKTLNNEHIPGATNNKGENIQVGHIDKIGTVTGNELVVFDSFGNSSGNGFKVYSPVFNKEVKEERTYYRDVEKEIKKEIDVPIYEGEFIHIQYGPKSDHNFELRLPHIDCDALNMNDISAKTADEALASIDMISEALAKVNEQRSMMGAQQNGIEALIRDESATVENTQAAESRIRDTDMATEMVNLTKLNILEQVTNSMIAQANQSPQGILSLLQ